jgi:hypothetical protein
LIQPSQLDWARLAAFIDGEGCIIITRAKPNHRQSNPQYKLIISVYNTDPRLAPWIQERFGGYIFVGKGDSRRKPRIVWQVTTKHAEEILRGCLDFFVLKREQAEVGLAFRALVVHCRFKAASPTLVLQREVLKQRLHQLHKQEVRVQ